MKPSAQTMSFYDLRDALAQPGCAVCRLKADAVDRFLDGLLWESVNDPGRRREIRQARGFCHRHAWSLVRVSASLGVAIITRDVLQSALAATESATFQATSPWSMRRVREALDPRQPAAAATAELVARLEPQAACPACVWAEKMEGVYLSEFVNHLLGQDGLLADYESSDGLCLPHFRQALARVRDERVFEALVNAQRSIWERLIAHLSEFIRKSDHRFHNETWGEERDAWLRAIAALAGAKAGPVP
ncbi:MAG TPA: DUF6062 family protein [Anaerolineae bacterium]|nr:DUF6062 family protein [Anaerolineae bacterium]